jgi:hypothetical protein
VEPVEPSLTSTSLSNSTSSRASTLGFQPSLVPANSNATLSHGGADRLGGCNSSIKFLGENAGGQISDVAGHSDDHRRGLKEHLGSVEGVATVEDQQGWGIAGSSECLGEQVEGDCLRLRYSPCGSTRAAMDPAAVGSPADMPSSG